MGRVKDAILECMEKAETIDQAVDMLSARGLHGGDLDDPMVWDMWYDQLEGEELKQAILREYRRIEADLSPENLNWDGERPRAQADAAFRRLTSRRAELVERLGREPSFSELYPEEAY
jgi:hypothetical protein